MIVCLETFTSSEVGEQLPEIQVPKIVSIFRSVVASDTPRDAVLAHVEVGRVHDITRVRHGFRARLESCLTGRNDLVEFFLWLPKSIEVSDRRLF